ncbi:MAG: DUF6288 domain-containing protein, partial [Verrucomicrobiales bacterium]
EGSRFFSKMTLASAHERELGHTGNYWSFLWGPAGAGLLGDEGLGQFLDEQGWYYDLCRMQNGGFINQPWAHKLEGPRGMNNHVAKGPEGCTASLAMAYAVPLRKLRMFQMIPPTS